MIIERTMHPHWLSNSWLVGDKPGGHAVLIDSGGPMQGIVETLERERLTLTHVLCTHHHYDHVAHNKEYRDRYACPVCGGHAERELFGDLDLELEGDEELESGELRIRTLHVPGHTAGQLAFVVNDSHVFTGDTLFRGSIGGTRGPGHTSYDDIRHSILEVLMRLPSESVVCPGHMGETSVAREWQENPFVRFWRGIDTGLDLACTALGEDATLLVRAEDYDGGHKCIVRFDDGRLDVVPGSRVSTDDEAN